MVPRAAVFFPELSHWFVAVGSLSPARLDSFPDMGSFKTGEEFDIRYGNFDDIEEGIVVSTFRAGPHSRYIPHERPFPWRAG